MKVILFGATGMVGQGVLRECLLDPEVERVLSIGRGTTGQQNPKLRELPHADFTDFSAIADELAGYDACFFCLGISSAGMSEADYRHVTYDFTLAAAQILAPRNPAMTFVYVSGTGTDSTERGRSMWARVKGATENALLKLPFKAAYMFRPGIIQPLHGVKSRTKLYRAGYLVAAPLFPILNAFFSKSMTTTEKVGRAMLAIAKHGGPVRLLENRDINAAAGAAVAA
ncbi:MAG TPA: NAD-dependent epimerase/dehydratase family protein [Polyangia bacterium]